MLNLIKKHIKTYWLSILLLSGTMLLLQYFFHSVCSFQILLGIPCPACGMSRAFLLFLQGKWKQSIQMHPLLPFVIIGILFFYILDIIKKNSRNLVKIYGIILLVFSIIIYVYRMKLYFPHIAPMIYREDNGVARIIYLLGGR